MYHEEQEYILRQSYAEFALWIYAWFGAKTSLRHHGDQGQAATLGCHDFWTQQVSIGEILKIPLQSDISLNKRCASAMSCVSTRTKPNPRYCDSRLASWCWRNSHSLLVTRHWKESLYVLSCTSDHRLALSPHSDFGSLTGTNHWCDVRVAVCSTVTSGGFRISCHLWVCP